MNTPTAPAVSAGVVAMLVESPELAARLEELAATDAGLKAFGSAYVPSLRATFKVCPAPWSARGEQAFGFEMRSDAGRADYFDPPRSMNAARAAAVALVRRLLVQRFAAGLRATPGELRAAARRLASDAIDAWHRSKAAGLKPEEAKKLLATSTARRCLSEAFAAAAGDEA